jgi:hypothetical protein
MSDRRPFTITMVRRDPEHGFWRARVTNGTTVDVDRRDGSWKAEVRTAPGARTFVRREVMPRVAAALQERVRPLERAERDAAKAAAEAAKASKAVAS